MNARKKRLLAAVVALSLITMPATGTNFGIGYIPEDTLSDFEKQDEDNGTMKSKSKKMERKNGHFA